MKSPKLATILRTFALAAAIVFAMWLRMQGISTLPEGQFTDTDAYLFLHQAGIISSEGHLPERDMHRWLPVGRDNRQMLNLYATVLGYTHAGVSIGFGDLSVYTVVRYMPVVCFGLMLVSLMFFFTRACGDWKLALIVGMYLTTLPGSIERSAAGFGDRDAWCLMLGTLSVLTYLTADRSADRNVRWTWTLVSALLMYLGGCSWEGFASFTVIVTSLEAWRFLSTDTEETFGLWLYSVWVTAFSVPLVLTAPLYSLRGGETEHLFAVITGNLGPLMLMPPVLLLSLRWVRWALLSIEPFASALKPHARRLPALLTLVCISLVVLTVFLMREGFQTAFFALRDNALRHHIGELAPPHFGYWCFRYGSLFLIGAVGAALAPVRLWGRAGHRLGWAIAGLAFIAFFREPIHTLFGDGTGNAFFYMAIVGVIAAACQLAMKGERFSIQTRPAATTVVMLLWFLIWVSLSRSAKRFDFFIGLALSFFTASVCLDIATRISRFLENPKWTTDTLRQRLPTHRVHVGIALLIGSAALLWGPTGGHLFRSYHAATQLRHASPGENTPLSNALTWMKTHLPPTSIVAAEWSYGTQLNVLGGVKTVTDSDHYIPHWIHLYEQHVRQTREETTALTFLLTHGATHLMVTEKQPPNTLLRGMPKPLSEAFIPRYPEADFQNAPVKIYELRYPKSIKSDPIYLQRHPETRTPHIEAPPHVH